MLLYIEHTLSIQLLVRNVGIRMLLSFCLFFTCHVLNQSLPFFALMRSFKQRQSSAVWTSLNKTLSLIFIVPMRSYYMQIFWIIVWSPCLYISWKLIYFRRLIQLRSTLLMRNLITILSWSKDILFYNLWDRILLLLSWMNFWKLRFLLNKRYFTITFCKSSRLD